MSVCAEKKAAVHLALLTAYWQQLDDLTLADAFGVTNSPQPACTGHAAPSLPPVLVSQCERRAEGIHSFDFYHKIVVEVCSSLSIMQPMMCAAKRADRQRHR